MNAIAKILTEDEAHAGFAGGIVFLLPDKRILVVKRAGSEENYGGHWSFPGGKAEEGESAEDAAKREAREELGPTPPLDGLQRLYTTITPNGFEFVTFVVQLKEEFPPALNEEHTDFKWASLDDLPEPMHPGVSDTVQRLKMKPDIFALDRDSVRTFDESGRMHIASAHISKACVNPYRGVEIPRWQDLGLDPERIYYMLRDPKELEAAASTFNNIQVLIRHVPVNANDPQKDNVVGTTGSLASFSMPFLDNELVIWSKDGIAAIESGVQKELSCGYGYTPVMEPGNFNGEHYDGRMTQIKGNHVALVSKGRAGPDVVVGDQALETKEKEMTRPLSRTAVRLQAALSALLLPKIALDSELKLSTALGTALSQLGATEKITRAALKKPNFRKAIIKMAQDAEEEMATPEAKKGGHSPDDVIMRVLDMVDKQVEAEPAGAVEEDADPEAEEGKEKPEGGKFDRKKAMDTLVKDYGCDEEKAGKICDMFMPKEAGENSEDDEMDGDEDPAAKEKDEEAKKKEAEKAMDEAIKLATKTAEENTMKRLAGIRAAEKAVLPLIGEVSTAMDSAQDIYKAALKAYDVSTEGVDPSAFPSMVALLAKTKAEGDRPRGGQSIVGDAALVEDRAAFDAKHGIASRTVRNLG